MSEHYGSLERAVTPARNAETGLLLFAPMDFRWLAKCDSKKYSRIDSELGSTIIPQRETLCSL